MINWWHHYDSNVKFSQWEIRKLTKNATYTVLEYQLRWTKTMYLVLKWMISYHLCFRYRYVLHHIRRIQRQIHCRRYLQFRLVFTLLKWFGHHFYSLYIYTSQCIEDQQLCSCTVCLCIVTFDGCKLQTLRLILEQVFRWSTWFPTFRFHFSNRDLLVHLRHDDHQGLSFIVDSSLIFQSVNITHLLSVGVIVENVSLTL